MDMMPMIGPVKGMKAEASASVITKEELKELIDRYCMGVEPTDAQMNEILERRRLEAEQESQLEEPSFEAEDND